MLTATMTTDKNIYGFEQYLLVRKGLQPITIQGYCRSASWPAASWGMAGADA